MTNRLIGSRPFVWKIHRLNAVLKLYMMNILTFHTLIDLLKYFTKDFEIWSIRVHIVSSYLTPSEKAVHFLSSSQWDKTGIYFISNEAVRIKNCHCTNDCNLKYLLVFVFEKQTRKGCQRGKTPFIVYVAGMISYWYYSVFVFCICVLYLCFLFVFPICVCYWRVCHMGESPWRALLVWLAAAVVTLLID